MSEILINFSGHQARGQKHLIALLARRFDRLIHLYPHKRSSTYPVPLVPVPDRAPDFRAESDPTTATSFPRRRVRLTPAISCSVLSAVKHCGLQRLNTFGTLAGWIGNSYAGAIASARGLARKIGVRWERDLREKGRDVYKMLRPVHGYAIAAVIIPYRQHSSCDSIKPLLQRPANVLLDHTTVHKSTSLDETVGRYTSTSSQQALTTYQRYSQEPSITETAILRQDGPLNPDSRSKLRSRRKGCCGDSAGPVARV